MKLNLALVLVAVVHVVSGHTFNHVLHPKLREFNSWRDVHNKTYEDHMIHGKRFQIWLENDKFIQEVNAQNLTYIVGHNKFSDLTNEEFKLFNRLNPIELLNKENIVEYDNSTARASINWVTLGKVIYPVDQGSSCGSCFSFSAIGAIESARAIKYNSLVRLSEQQIVDCDTLDSSCNGGLMTNVFKFVQENNGVCSDADYSYIGVDGTCKKCTNVVNTTVSNWINIQQSENALMAALNKGPVSVAIEADQQAFQFYSSGIFTAPCGTNLDHGVLAVGYDTDYWLVRNSWGASWGDNGFIKMARGSKYAPNGQCGILMSASQPMV